jgi:hypothetical protein
MYNDYIAPRPGLMAEWAMDGDGSDVTGAHNATIDMPDGSFSHVSPLPFNATVPVANPAGGAHLVLDGRCSPDEEYAGAPIISMDDALIFPVNTEQYLWLCVMGISEGPGGDVNYHVSVVLDPQHVHGGAPGPSELALSVWEDGTRTTKAGNGAAFVPVSGRDDLWNAVYRSASAGGASTGIAPQTSRGNMEFRIDNRLLGGWGHSVGLSVVESWNSGASFPSWPYYAQENLPYTWGDLTLPLAPLYLPALFK